MRTVAFIINRTRVRDSRRLRRECGDAARATRWKPVFLQTTARDPGTGLAREAVTAGAGLVFAAGGDGTVRACAEALAGTGVPLAIMPLGTANLAARSLGVPARAGEALAAGFAGRDRVIDVGDADGMTFLVMAGIGLDARVVGATSHTLKGLLGWTAYAATGAAHVVASGHLFRRGHGFTVRLDSAPPLVRRARSVVAANAGLLPGGFLLLPDAEMDDGLLDAGILAPVTPADWFRVARQVITHDATAAGGHLERHRAARVEIRSDEPLPRQVDGEVIGLGLGLTVTLRPAALTVRVPLLPERA